MSGSVNAGVPTPTNQRLAGVTKLTIDGSSYNVISFNYGLSKVENSPMVSLSGVDGFKSMPTPGFIAAVIRDAASVNVGSFSTKTNSTVVLELANGKQISGSGMFITGAQDVEGAEATFSVRFDGTNVGETGITG